MTKPKTIGLALGSGAALGLAHIGVIKTLLDAGFEINCIAGTSIGAVVGGIYATTLDIKFLEDAFLEIAEKYAVSREMPHPTKHLLFRNPEKVNNLLMQKIRGVKIQETKIPFKTVATDIKTGEEIVLGEGSMEEALKASAAIPLLFKPVEVDGRMLIDGGFTDPVPTDIVRSMHPDFVLGVDVSSKWPSLEGENLSIFGIESAIIDTFSALEYQIAKDKTERADFTLHPPVSSYHWNDFRLAEEIIQKGVNETRNNIREIRKLTHSPKPAKKPLQSFIDFISGNDY